MRSFDPSRLVLLLACYWTLPFAWAASLSPIDELRQTFTVGGEPVPPGIFRDMGDGDLADSGAIIVTIDVKAATGSNLYADPIKRNGAWVSQARQDPAVKSLTEEEAYRFIGITTNGMFVVLTAYSGGGSGVFFSLHLLTAEAARGFDGEGKRYERLNVTTVRSISLGDRWNGDVKITGDDIAITTTDGRSMGQDQNATTTTIKAERP